MGNRRLGRKRLESVLKQLDGTAADSSGSRAGAAGFQMPPWQLMPAKYYGFLDDFDSVNGNLGVAADGDMAQSSAVNQGVWRANIDGTSDAIALDNSAVGGILNVTTGTSDNEETHLTAINSGFAIDASNSRKLWMTTRFKVNDADLIGFFVGLCSDNGAEETSVLTDGGGATEDAIGAYMLDGSASVALTALTAVGDSETTTSLDTDIADGVFVTVSFYFNGSILEVYVNGAKKASISANLPADGTILFPAIHAASRSGASKILSVDYMVICQER